MQRPLRPVTILVLAVLSGLCAPATAARATASASATIVVPAIASALPAAASPAVSIASVRVGAQDFVTVAFN